MPIDIRCEHCHSSFQLADKALEKFAGKKVKCPTCKQPILVPGEPTSGSAGSSGEVVQSGQISAAQSSAQQRPPVLDKPAASKPDGATAKTIATKKQAADKWYLQTEEGEQYGPVTKAELDQWLAEGRIDASCQILCEGWDQWRWAEDVYPQLAAPPMPVLEGAHEPEETLGQAGAGAGQPELPVIDVRPPLPPRQSAPALDGARTGVKRPGILIWIIFYWIFVACSRLVTSLAISFFARFTEAVYSYFPTHASVSIFLDILATFVLYLGLFTLVVCYGLWTFRRWALIGARVLSLVDVACSLLFFIEVGYRGELFVYAVAFFITSIAILVYLYGSSKVSELFRE